MDDLLIDESYTRTIDYIKTLPQSEQDIYYDGIRLMQKTLKLCEGAITTTEAMAAELKSLYLKHISIVIWHQTEWYSYLKRHI